MNRKALIVDDDICCLNVLEEYLLDENFTVTSSLVPTCQMLEMNSNTCPISTSCRHDIIISDNHMPVMKGLEFFEYQRQRNCKIPSYRKALISGDISSEDQRIAENIGYKVFHKPTPLNLIDSWINEVLS